MKLNIEQERAAHHVQGPMLVLAGPGSGKTHLLVERICYLIEHVGVPPQKILVITFSKKAAEQMRERFRNRVKGAHYPVCFGTFHSVFYQILSKFYDYSFESILNSKTKREYAAKAGKRLNIDKAYSFAWQNEMIDNICIYKTFEEEYINHDLFKMMSIEEIEQFNSFACEYSKLCDFDGKIDFEDILIKCRNLLFYNNSALEYCHDRFEYILIDEFQDINRCQYETIRMIAGKKSNLFCVGDDDQSIYAFRGARPDILRQFIDDYNECEVVNLSVNYRCMTQIIEAADRLIRHNTDRIERSIQKSALDEEGLVELIECDNSKDEAEKICETVGELVTNHGYMRKDIAVIYRSLHVVSVLEDLLRAKMIPYYNSEKSLILYDVLEITWIISYLRIANGTENISDYLNVLNHPQRNLSREALSPLFINDARPVESKCVYPGRSLIECLLDYYKDDRLMLEKVNKLRNDIIFISHQPPAAAVMYILYGMNLHEDIRKSASQNRQAGDASELIYNIKSRAAAFTNIKAWLEVIDNISENSDENNDDGNKVKNDDTDLDCINLISAHASKGLEYKTVIIAGLTEGLFPHKKSLATDEIEEERRLMYVAMTRAKERLYLCARGKNHGKAISRFVDEVFGNDLKHES